jgi:excisionase family DNA binding protein
MSDEWLTVAQAAEISGYHHVTIRKLLLSGQIEGRKFATVWQVKRSSLKAYLRKAEKMGGKRGPKKRA